MTGDRMGDYVIESRRTFQRSLTIAMSPSGLSLRGQIGGLGTAPAH